MKIRSDYVSNSSSSSFVVVLPKTMTMGKFIDDVVKSCTDKMDDDYEPEFKTFVDDSNRRNLDYCMNTYRLVYLGMLRVDEVTGTVEGKEECDSFLRCMKDWGVPGLTILNQTEDKIDYKEPRWISGITVTPNVMEYSLAIPDWRMKENAEEAKKSSVESIVQAAKCSDEYSRFFRGDTSEIYEITMDTIKNTELLLEAGYEIDFDNWCKDLDALKKRLENGDRIFGITMNQSGDGMSSDTIYALDGWDSDFNKYANVQILHSECG